MGLRASIWAYPWDLLDNGPRAVIDEIRDLGFSELSVAASYHGGRVIVAGNVLKRVHFPSAGAVYFRPEAKKYGRLVPPIADLADEREPLIAAYAAAESSGLRLSLWTVCLHNDALGHAHPDCCQESAFGERIINCLCPANPEVRQYLHALVGDLSAQFPGCAIELESASYLPWEPPFQIEIAAVEMTRLVGFLLSLCFCSHCRWLARAVGVGIDELRQQVRVLIDQAFQGALADASPADVADLLGSNGDAFEQWMRARERVVSTLHSELQDCAKSGAELRPILFKRPDALWEVGLDATPLQATFASAVVNCYEATPSACADRYAEYTALFSEPEFHLSAAVRVASGGLSTASEVEACVAALVHAGADGAAFYNYGLMTSQQRSWIKSALVGRTRGSGGLR